MEIKRKFATRAMIAGAAVAIVAGAGMWAVSSQNGDEQSAHELITTTAFQLDHKLASRRADLSPWVAQMNEDPRTTPGVLWPDPPEPRLDLYKQNIVVYAPDAWKSPAGRSLLDAGLVFGPQAADLIVEHAAIAVDRTRDWHVPGPAGVFINPGSARLGATPRLCTEGPPPKSAMTIPSAGDTRFEWSSCVTVEEDRNGVIDLRWRTEWNADIPVALQAGHDEQAPAVRRYADGEFERRRLLREGESIVRFIPFPENNELGHLQILTRPGRDSLVGVHIFAVPATEANDAFANAAEPIDQPAEGWIAHAVTGDEARAVARSIEQRVREADRPLLAAREFSGWRRASRAWSSETSGTKVVSAHDMIPFPRPQLQLILSGKQVRLPLAPDQIILLVPPQAGGEPEAHESVYLVVFRGHASDQQ